MQGEESTTSTPVATIPAATAEAKTAGAPFDTCREAAAQSVSEPAARGGGGARGRRRTVGVGGGGRPPIAIFFFDELDKAHVSAFRTLMTFSTEATMLSTTNRSVAVPPGVGVILLLASNFAAADIARIIGSAPQESGSCAIGALATELAAECTIEVERAMRANGYQRWDLARAGVVAPYGAFTRASLVRAIGPLAAARYHAMPPSVCRAIDKASWIDVSCRVASAIASHAVRTDIHRMTTALWRPLESLAIEIAFGTSMPTAVVATAGAARPSPFAVACPTVVVRVCLKPPATPRDVSLPAAARGKEEDPSNWGNSHPRHSCRSPVPPDHSPILQPSDSGCMGVEDDDKKKATCEKASTGIALAPEVMSTLHPVVLSTTVDANCRVAHITARSASGVVIAERFVATFVGSSDDDNQPRVLPQPQPEHQFSVAYK